MAAEIQGFDWDAANVGHVMLHGVTPFEVEEAVVRPHVTLHARTVAGEERWKLFGRTAAGRYLVVVFTIRRKHFRTVTAYQMNATERRKYGPQID
ncbi:MAG TPA: BrnT family toxin [Bryobacteraceae bacterium]|nr:BrnT family toxin [Bryobacteraceae bacterium]